MGSRQNFNSFVEMPSTPVTFFVSNLETLLSTSILKEGILTPPVYKKVSLVTQVIIEA